MRSRLPDIALLIVVVVVALVLAEVGSRLIMPVSPGFKRITLDGEAFPPGPSRTRMPPGLTYRMVGDEFDALVTTTDEGHRVPGAGSRPDIVFIGDSFTFGAGLSDDETFVMQFCSQAGLGCANLGRAGTGTRRQLDVLEDFLTTEGWRPREVWLFMFAMTSALMAGNDVGDVLHEKDSQVARTRRERAASDDSFWGWILSYRRVVLEYSNLARIAQFQLGNWLRAALWPEADQQRMEEGLEAMRDQLERFAHLSQEYGFDPQIFLIHPIQDLIWDTHEKTLADIARIAGDIPVIDTAEPFLDQPERYYFPYDGHINADGASLMARTLLDHYRARDNGAVPSG